MYDPTMPITATPSEPDADDEADLAVLLGRQLTIAGVLQDALLKDRDKLSTRELKDLASSASTLLSLSHRTEQALSSLTTYRAFVATVLEFLKSHSDLLGEDLLAELRKTARDMRMSEGAMALMQ